MKNVFDRLVLAAENAPELLARGADSAVENEAAESRVQQDRPGTPSIVKEITQVLLGHGYLEEASRADLFRQLVVNESGVNIALEPLDLTLRIDTMRGVAFLAVAQVANENSTAEDGWLHPLVRRQRLTLEQSLLIAILRQAFVKHEQAVGVGQANAKVAVDSLLADVAVYFGDSGSDAKNESRLLRLLDQLKTYGIVSEVDTKQEVTIRPLIAHLASPESLAGLLQTLRTQATGGNSQEADR
jgi:hypothetical protein